MCSYNILNGGTNTKCSRIPWKTMVMCFYLILAMKLASCEEMPSIRKFFHLKNNDLTKVSWAQGIYRIPAARRAINGKVMMIGGNVTLERSRHDKNNPIPTMYRMTWRGKKTGEALGMPLRLLLEMVADAKSGGVKLNFNRLKVFKQTIKLLKNMRRQIKFPLWLNADMGKMKDKDIDEFLSLCKHNFPKATISIGMLPKGKKLSSEREYNAKLVTQMKDTLTRNNVTQAVAFPVRLLTAIDSLDTLAALKYVRGITDSALYMYFNKFHAFSSDDISKINKFINFFGKDRIYLDTLYNVLREHLLTSNGSVFA